MCSEILHDIVNHVSIQISSFQNRLINTDIHIHQSCQCSRSDHFNMQSVI